METETGVQIIDEVVCISHSPNAFGKGMNPTIFQPTMNQTELGMATSLGEGKLWIQKLLNFAKKTLTFVEPCSCWGVG